MAVNITIGVRVSNGYYKDTIIRIASDPSDDFTMKDSFNLFLAEITKHNRAIMGAAKDKEQVSLVF